MEHKITFTDKVYLESLDDYEYENVKSVVFPMFDKVLCDNGWGKDFFEGKNVAVKPNLLHKTGVEKCVTTHPSYTRAACEYFTSLGASVIVCDSPGGLYNKALVEGVAKETGTLEAAKLGGGVFNEDYGFEMRSDHEYSKYSFNIINPLVKADVIVNLARLKTHALCEMTAAVKNMFGSIPGLQKAEQHARFPSKDSFASMICDVCLINSPQINLVDCVICMEGNGPSGGTLRKMGAVAVSANPFAVDLLCCHMMGYGYDEVGTIKSAVSRGLCPDSVEKLEIIGDDYKKYVCKFKRPDSTAGGLVKQIPSVFGGRLRDALERKPVINKKKCIGCGICKNNCPVDAIVIKDKKAQIDKTKCIKCYCCQEFCPKIAVKARNIFGI